MDKSARNLFFSIFVMSSLFVHADPWGKDADLSLKQASMPFCKECRTPLLNEVAELLIGFHQVVISPADGPRSHYLPSSSQYTLDAIRRYGFFHGFLMGCDRLMRENSDLWIYRLGSDAGGNVLKLDPVP